MGCTGQCAIFHEIMKHSPAKEVLARMFIEAARQIRYQSAMLSKLDSVGGDGDHGETISRAVTVLESAVDVRSPKTMSTMLLEAGWAVMDVDGGASSAILGTFVGGMGNVEFGEEFSARKLAESFESGLRAVMRQTRARIGDKTLMDALIPAVEAYRQAVEDDVSPEAAMTIAAASADAGAISTAELVARLGRARSLGERTLGNVDAGAASIAILFAGFRDALNSIDDGDSDV